MSFKECRKRAGLDCEQAATALGVSKVCLWAWEKGEWMPRTAQLPNIAKVYGCTVDALLKNEKAAD